MPDVYLRSIEPLIAIVLAMVCGSTPAIAALLGRFLPRLGPLVIQAALSFGRCRHVRSNSAPGELMQPRCSTSLAPDHRVTRTPACAAASLPRCFVASASGFALVVGLVTGTSNPFAKPPHHGCAVPDISDLLGAMTRPTTFRRPF